MKKFIIYGVCLLCVLSFSGCDNESKDLKTLKALMSYEYNPSLQKTEFNNITSYNTVDINMNKAIEIILSSRAPDITSWLKDNIGNYNGKYVFVFAYRLASQKALISEYWFWRTAAIYRSMLDAVLCKDEYVGQYMSVLMMEILSPADGFYSESEVKAFLKDKNNIRIIMENLKEWDNNNPIKGSPAWFCNSGHGVFTSDNYPEDMWPTKRGEFKDSFFESSLSK